MIRPHPIRVQELENRIVPALFGIPWSNAQHLTLSFVPDGTQVDGVGSTLFATMNADTGLPPAAWQQQILKAVEAWAGPANINVGVVSDSGDPIGTPGAPEGDPRFGDIRVSARPLSANVLAITEPPGPLGDTRAGDIVINSSALFSVGGGGSTFDLYSAMLQETGHAFGIDNSLDPASPMYETYGGVRTGLTAGDVANIQSLYGPRQSDAYEGPGGNDTFATAYDLSTFGNFYNFVTPMVQADITTPTDVDYFKIQTMSSNPNGLSFQLNAGMSLLAAKMTIFDAAGNVINAVQSTGPATGALTVSLPTVAPNAYYYVKVEAANPAFAIGAYQLSAVFNPSAPTLQGFGGISMGGTGLPTGNSISNPTVLTTSPGYADSTHYDTIGAVQAAGASVYYQIQSPAVIPNHQGTLTLSARALNPTALAPTIQAFDANQQPVATQVLANGNGSYIVQINNANLGQSYYLAVAGQNGGTGAFEFTADFNTQAIALQQLASGTLTGNSSVNFTSLTVNRSQVIYLALSAGSTSDGSQAGVRLGIFNANGQAVTSLFAKAGSTVTGSVYLAPGEYTVRFEGLTPAGGQLTSLGYNLQGTTLTDPIDPPPDDPSLGGLSLTAGDFNVAIDTSIAYINLALESLGTVIW